jgi:hypothetical protein
MVAKTRIKKSHKSPQSLSDGLKDALQTSKAPATVIPAPTTSAPQAIKSVVVVVGGKQGKPVTENVALVPVVKASELSNYGMSKRDITIRLAKNLLAGATFEKDLLQKDGSPVWSLPSLRNEKRDFFYIGEHMKQAEILDAWSAALHDRKRYDQPTLQALGKACRAWRVTQGKVEPKKSPMEVFAAACLVILRNPAIALDERMRQVIGMLAQKAGESVVEQAEQKVA